MVIKPAQETFFELAAKNGATRDFEQIDAFDCWAAIGVSLHLTKRYMKRFKDQSNQEMRIIYDPQQQYT